MPHALAPAALAHVQAGDLEHRRAPQQVRRDAGGRGARDEHPDDRRTEDRDVHVQPAAGPRAGEGAEHGLVGRLRHDGPASVAQAGARLAPQREQVGEVVRYALADDDGRSGHALLLERGRPAATARLLEPGPVGPRRRSGIMSPDVPRRAGTETRGSGKHGGTRGVRGGTVPVGAGTALNVVTVLLGSALGVALGHRLPERTRSVVTDGLGLVTLLVAALSAAAVLDPVLATAVGEGAPVLVVLGSLLLGGVAGSLLRVEDRLEGLGAALQARLAQDGGDRSRFVEGFVTASLVFCVGPLTVLGSLSDGLGRGIDQLALKSTLDGVAAVAFAASLGWGVAASALVVLVVQGSLTAVGALVGGVVPEAAVSATTAVGGLLLVGVGLRLLAVRAVPVGDLLPALLVAPLLTQVVAALR